MKKIVLSFAVAVMAIAMNAQTVSTKNYAGSSRFTDNWSLGVTAGTTEQFSEMDHFTPTLIITTDKYITPWFGLGGDLRLLWGTRSTLSKHYTVLDEESLSGYAKINLTNAILGYQGKRRMFEPVVYTGLGWMHINRSGSNDYNNQMIYRAGMEFNFNLGKSRAWAVQLNPSVVYGCLNNGHLRQHAGAFEMSVGAVYHFKTSNGTHDFAKAQLRDQSEIDALNNTIASLQSDNAAKAGQIADDANKIKNLQAEIDALKKQGPKVVTSTTTVTNNSENLECYVYFNQGKSTIAASQLPNVERIATFLNHNEGSIVIVKGYASPEGSVEINEKLAQARAEAVKTQLVKKYRIDPSRISAEGQGVGNSFSEPDWNRVSICSIKKNKSNTETKTTTK